MLTGNTYSAEESVQVGFANLAYPAESLDKEVNGGILDEQQQPTSVQSDNTQSSPNVEVQPQDDNEVLQTVVRSWAAARDLR